MEAHIETAKKLFSQLESWHLIGAFVLTWFVLAPLWLAILWWLLTAILLTHIGGWAYRKFTRKDVTGKTVLITGGAMGLGKATAKAFAKNGNRIVLWDIQEDKLKEAAAEIKKEFSVEVLTYQVNVTDESLVSFTAQKVIDEVGYVDIVILNAGVVSAYPLIEMPMDKMRRVFEVNVFHLFYTSKPFLTNMVKDTAGRGGHFVIIASVAGYHGMARLTDYCASKAAALSFAEGLQVELGEYKNISKTVVCPYFINTGMFHGTTPLRFFKFLEEKDVAKSIYDAVSLKKELLVTPWFFHAVHLMKGLLPTLLTPYIDVILGSSKAMLTFHGRRV